MRGTLGITWSFGGQRALHDGTENAEGIDVYIYQHLKNSCGWAGKMIYVC
jgi:hypothetical protein